ncbi:ion transporter [Caenispirillum salinarum]|uniref:ion transporter n=1 Tax=Caenispirillum salinarum TaxID=859058 RepID=UPI003850BFA7
MAEETASWRMRVRGFVESPRVQRFILALIVINAVILGLETSSAVMEAVGPALIAIDTVILGVFVVEIALRIAAHGWRFFRDPWGVFDFIVVGIALVPQTGPFSVLRALRVLRVLRVVSAVPRMRRVVAALLSAIPGLGSIIALLALVFYVAGVMATKLFGASFPEWFGTLPESVYTLFQVMTLESWSMGIVRPVMEVYPYAWLFFVPFIAIATFTMLNLFIAVVVNAMQSDYQETQEAAEATAHAEREEMLDHIRALRVEMADLRTALGTRERSARE